MPLPDLPPTAHEEHLLGLARDLAALFAEWADAAEAQGDLPPEVVTGLKASGYPALTVPRALGGLGASLHEFALAQEVLGRADTSMALVAAMNAHLLGGLSENGGWPHEVYARLCHASAQRGALSNSLASEPELGSPSRGGLPRTRAERVEDGWRLTGRKTWATGARALDFYVVSAATPEDEVWRFVVPAGSPGVSIEDTWQGALALRGSGSHDVVFEEVFVPGELAVPPSPPSPTGGAWFWTAVAATYLGTGQGALDQLVAYARERVPTALGQPIATLPKVQAAVGEMSLTLLQARALLHAVTRAWADPGRRPELLPALAGAKLACTNAAIHVTDLALRAAGGAALGSGLDLERRFRDARAGLMHPPADDQTLRLLGEGLLMPQARSAGH